MINLVTSLVVLFLAIWAQSTNAQYQTSLGQSAQQALFIRDIDAPSPYNEHVHHHFEHTSDRVPRQSAVSPAAMDQTVQGILEWLQGKYAGARKARQESPARQYLPARVNPTTTQKPRPFQTNGYDGRALPTGYPFPQSPTPTFNVPETPAPYSPSSTGGTPSPYNPSTGGTPAPFNPSGSPTPYNIPSPSPSPGPSQQPYNPSSSPQAPYPSEDTGPSQIPFISSTGTGFSVTGGSNFPSPTGAGISPTGGGISPTGPSAPGVFPQSPQGIPVDNNIDSDDNHPPHIHDINVQCAKDQMTINLEFNRPFNGIIYSKGYYSDPQCRYVSPNSGQTKFSFTVYMRSCGTQFIDEFREGKQAYLENVLVLQNEPGIQEVWDSIRSVRCLWEGNLNKAVSVALSVGMLSQEIVTFSGDTATARLDIQMGRGPFAPAATGLVKIGELMTLVVTVEGDPAFNVLVRSCIARDNDPNSGNMVQLTDDRGCNLKPKLMGAIQTARDPNTNAVIAYAIFRAFKFPDVMDLTIECNVELCKTECAPCPDPNQILEPNRRRRSADNSTLELTDPVTVGRRLRVFLPEDLEESRQSAAMVINVGSPASDHDSVCLSSSVFLLSSTFLLSILATSCICSAVLWLRMQRQSMWK
ncbi:uncharacterized protein LOC124367236 [Homalodisca vitripennis]|nr:uncharacterized protein LOC124367236 [Homalodisca vitripennis]